MKTELRVRVIFKVAVWLRNAVRAWNVSEKRFSVRVRVRGRMNQATGTGLTGSQPQWVATTTTLAFSDGYQQDTVKVD